MDKKLKVMLIGVAISVATVGVTSASAFELGVEGGLSIHSPGLTINSGGATTPTLGSKTNITYGVFAGTSALPGFQLESGLMLIPRRFTETDQTGIIADTKFNNLVVPVMVRFTLLPMISIGGGAYYAMGTGQISTTITPAGGTAGAEVLSDFDSNGGIKKSGYGALASARLDLPMAPLVSLLLDARYLMDLSDRSGDSSESLKGKDLQILTGLSFGF